MKGDPSQFNALSKADRIIAALRNRTSEPEAGFLGHLVTPKGGDAVFVPKGERISLISQGGSVTPIYDGPQNVTAPSTADKLKVAVEGLSSAMKFIDWVLSWESVAPDAPIMAEVKTARQALAALNEGGE